MMVIPKKKKIKLVLAILAQRVISFFDQNTENTSSEELFDLLAASKGALYNFDDNDANWSQEESDVWTSFEAIESALNPIVSSELTEETIEELSGDLEEKLDRL